MIVIVLISYLIQLRRIAIYLSAGLKEILAIISLVRGLSTSVMDRPNSARGANLIKGD